MKGGTRANRRVTGFFALSALFAAAAIGGDTQAAPAMPAPVPVSMPHYSCHDDEGRRVAYRDIGWALLHNYGQAIAFATKDGDTPVILYNGDVLEDLPLQARRFIAAHECAHHTLGHVNDIEERIDAGRAVTSAFRKAIELEADCAAAAALRRRYGYGSADFETAMAWNRGAPESRTHPSHARRLQKILSCAEFAPSVS